VKEIFWVQYIKLNGICGFMMIAKKKSINLGYSETLKMDINGADLYNFKYSLLQ